MKRLIRDKNPDCPSHSMRLIEGTDSGKLYRCRHCGKTNLTDVNNMLSKLIMFFTIIMMVIIFLVAFISS
jgi:tRNA(Ile2) C34 agmatinyltransferase TiaS